MWSHYTNAYQGFVIGFDYNNPFFHQVNSNITRIHEVNYSDKRPVFFNFTDFWRGNISLDTFKEMLLTKSTHWKYEKELRMFAQPLPSNNTGIKDNNGFDVYTFDFPPECLKEIIFGHLTKSNDKRKILDIIARRYPHVELFEARFSETKFDLDIKPYRK